MKKIILGLILGLTLVNNSAKADWTDTPLTEPGMGCALLGGAAYLSGQSAQNSMIACLVGGVAGYAVEKYYTNKVSNKYKADIDTLKSQLDEIVHQRAVNNSMGLTFKDLVIKETIVPAKQLPDGSIQLETIRLKATLPGQGLILGE